MNTLDRRQFLKLTGLVLASGVVLSAPQAFKAGVRLFSEPQIRFGRHLIRGTAHGTILSSSDEGKTWEKLVSFGEHHSILQLVQHEAEIHANLGLGSHDFWLRSADGQKWYIV